MHGTKIKKKSEGDDFAGRFPDLPCVTGYHFLYRGLNVMCEKHTFVKFYV